MMFYTDTSLTRIFKEKDKKRLERKPVRLAIV